MSTAFTFDKDESIIRTGDDKITLRKIRWYQDLGHQFILTLGDHAIGFRIRTNVQLMISGRQKIRVYTIEDMGCAVTWWDRYPEGQHTLKRTLFKDRMEQDRAITLIREIFSQYDQLIRGGDQASKAVFTDELGAKLNGGALIEKIHA